MKASLDHLRPLLASPKLSNQCDSPRTGKPLLGCDHHCQVPSSHKKSYVHGISSACACPKLSFHLSVAPPCRFEKAWSRDAWTEADSRPTGRATTALYQFVSLHISLFPIGYIRVRNYFTYFNIYLSSDSSSPLVVPNCLSTFLESWNLATAARLNLDRLMRNPSFQSSVTLVRT